MYACPPAFSFIDCSIHVVETELTGARQVPPNNEPYTGYSWAIIDTVNLTMEVFPSANVPDITASQFSQGEVGVSGSVVFPFQVIDGVVQNETTVTQAQIAIFLAGGFYANVLTAAYPGGIIRGQLEPTSGTGSSRLLLLLLLLRSLPFPFPLPFSFPSPSPSPSLPLLVLNDLCSQNVPFTRLTALMVVFVCPPTSLLLLLPLATASQASWEKLALKVQTQKQKTKTELGP